MHEVRRRWEKLKTIFRTQSLYTPEYFKLFRQNNGTFDSRHVRCRSIGFNYSSSRTNERIEYDDEVITLILASFPFDRKRHDKEIDWSTRSNWTWIALVVGSCENRTDWFEFVRYLFSARRLGPCVRERKYPISAYVLFSDVSGYSRHYRIRCSETTNLSEYQRYVQRSMRSDLLSLSSWSNEIELSLATTRPIEARIVHQYRRTFVSSRSPTTRL